MTRLIKIFLVGVLAVTCVSCQSQKVDTQPLVTGQAADGAELAYLLAQKKWCANDEACSFVLHWINGSDQAASFAERIETLKAKGLIKSGWHLEAAQPVSKGTLAYMICQAKGIKGGLWLRILPGKRYAYREAVDREIMQKGSEYEPLTGPEVVGIIGRAARDN